MTNLSIIIVNWNTKDILSDCLRSIYKETKDIKFETIVIDNNSSDNSVGMIKQNFPQVLLIENKDNKGFAAANNQGINIAKGKYLLLLNSDTIILDNALKKAYEFATSNQNADVIGCKILNKDRTLQPSCSMFPSLLNRFLMLTYLYKIFPKSKFFGRAQMTWFNYDRKIEVDVISGCFMVINRKAIDRVGPMDEDFFMYSEEVDWCWRFKKSGYKIVFTPEAQIIHLGGASAIKHGAQRAQIKDRSTIRFMLKHWPKPKIAIALAMMFLFYSTRLITILPKYLFIKQSQDLNKIQNHIAGLKGLFNLKKYLDQ